MRLSPGFYPEGHALLDWLRAMPAEASHMTHHLVPQKTVAGKRHSGWVVYSTREVPEAEVARMDNLHKTKRHRVEAVGILGA